jgi:hypothetical protein
LYGIEDKFDAIIDECFSARSTAGGAPGRFRLSAPLAGLAVLNWKHGGGPMVARRVAFAERPDLLPALRKPPGVFYLPDALGARGSPKRIALPPCAACRAGTLGRLDLLRGDGGPVSTFCTPSPDQEHHHERQHLRHPVSPHHLRRVPRRRPGRRGGRLPAGPGLSEEAIQRELDRRKPGQGGPAATARKESDTVRLLSGVFEGLTTARPSVSSS